MANIVYEVLDYTKRVITAKQEAEAPLQCEDKTDWRIKSKVLVGYERPDWAENKEK